MSCNPFGTEYSPLWADRRTNIVVSDSSSTKYVGLNPEKKAFSLFRIDGYVIPNQNKLKCDYLLVRCIDNNSFFVELKGSDLVHAANQIISSIKELTGVLEGHVIHARIVLTKTPSLRLPHASLVRLDELVRATGGNLRRENVQLNETH